MDATFICSRCSKPNVGPSNLPAGVCHHEACRGLLCEACSEFHDSTKPPGHSFKWARDMDDGGDPVSTVSDIPVKSVQPPKPPTPATTAPVVTTPPSQAPPPPTPEVSAEAMLAEMHSLKGSIDAGVASVNAATTVRSLSCEC